MLPKADITRRRRNALMILTILLLLVNVSYVLLTRWRADEQLQQSLDSEGATLQSTFHLTLDTTYAAMLQLATAIADDQRVQQAFWNGRLAWQREGDGGGGRQTTLFRQQLLKLISPMWQRQMLNFSARQFEFHFGPGAVSFLRVHQPDLYGDRTDALRHMIVDLNNDHMARSGLEFGRTHAALRSAVPVWHESVGLPRGYIGALEVGTSFEPILQLMLKQTGKHAAILLERERIDQSLWQQFKGPYQRQRDAGCPYYLEAATSDEIQTLLANKEFRAGYPGSSSTLIIQNHGKIFAVTRFPLFDYAAQRDKSRESCGVVVIWHDITDRYIAHTNDKVLTIIFAVVLFCLFELMLIAGFRYSCQRLQELIQEQTAEIATLAQRNDAILNAAGDGIIGLDQDGAITFANHSTESLTGWSIDEMLGKRLHELLQHSSMNGKTLSSNECAIMRCCRAGDRTEIAGERFTRKDGTVFQVDYLVTPLHDHSQGAVLVFRDITERHELEQRIIWLAHHDPLTGLPNRSAFVERLETLQGLCRRDCRTIAVCYLDLDGFKQINDQFGHEAGDAVLCETARRLNTVLRETDVIARFGGDEFVAAMQVTPDQPDGAQLVAERLLQALRQPVLFLDHELSVGVSIGIAYYDPQQENSIDQTIRHADQALYQAKREGKHRIVTFRFPQPS